MTKLCIAQDPVCDEVLSSHPFALLVGMLLDQQFPMERAFQGPAKILDRFGSIDPGDIAAADEEEFVQLCVTPPAIHRYGGVMGRRVRELAAVVRDEYEGDSASIWTTAGDTSELLRRLKELPGFGDQKARIFAALLAKQFGVQPPGWQKAIGLYAEKGSFRSVADVVDAESLQKVRDFKKSAKAAAKAAAAKP